MEITDYSEFAYHPTSEAIVAVLRKMNQNTSSDSYFRVITSFYMAQAASTMRASVSTEDRGEIPINLYALLTAPSGFGKTKSVNILERELLGSFYHNFMEYTLPNAASTAMDNEATRASNRNSTDFEEELEKLQTEYDSYGAYVFSFPEGSGPAFRQVRAKAQLANIGSTNLIIDELGYNLVKLGELLDAHFEVYDVGLIKDKITKSSSDNKRHKQRTTPVPSNMLAFGTPDKLFDGSITEKELLGRLESGYGRRFIFAEGQVGEDEELSPEELYDRLVAGAKSTNLDELKRLFSGLADPENIHKKIPIEREQGILLTRYKMECEFLAKDIPSHQSTRKAELQHRYFRAMKLAGAYAFTDGTSTVTTGQLMAAIRVVQDSGKDFQKLITRPKAHVRLAQYIATIPDEVTHADLIEELAFYPSARNKQEEILAMAIAWGHKNHHIIKRTVLDGIDFFKGESLHKTDLNKLRVSHSFDQAYQYENSEYTWEQIHALCQTPDKHFVNHFLTDGHRSDDTVQIGSDFLVLDCDGEVTLKDFSDFMKGTLCYVYTTKRHTNEANRFRALVPLKYHVKLGKADYKEFVDNILADLPFTADDCSNQRSKKWLTNHGAEGIIEGELFDPVPYFPNTKKNTDRIEETKALGNLDKIQRFFVKQWHTGRNNTLLKYGTMLIDSGSDLHSAITAVTSFNKTFSDALSEDELNDTVFKTLSKKVM